MSFDKNIMAKILSKLSGKISNECLSKKYYSSHVIEVSDVIDSMEKLKVSKSDGINNLKWDVFINGCYSLFTLISLLFSALLRHGVIPNNTLLATLIPISKNKWKCLSDNSNYRAIALGNIIFHIYVTMFSCCWGSYWFL